MDWKKTELRNIPYTVEYRIFESLKKMIAVRQELSAFADHINRELLHVDNPHLFVFSRFDAINKYSRILLFAILIIMFKS